MTIADTLSSNRFHLWLVLYDGPWHPDHLRALPPCARFVGPIVHDDDAARGDGCVSAEEAGAYCDAFNEAMLRDDQHRWALALPVTVRYEGEPQPGDAVVSTDES